MIPFLAILLSALLLLGWGPLPADHAAAAPPACTLSEPVAGVPLPPSAADVEAGLPAQLSAVPAPERSMGSLR